MLVPAPVIKALQEYAATGVIRFHMPGHKGSKDLKTPLQDLLGETVFLADVTNVPGMDDLHQPNGIIREAQGLAARTFGADATYFLINGSSCGLMALVMATCRPGEEILLPRNIHRSILSGVILSGAIPVYFRPAYDPELLLPTAVEPKSIRDALQNHPQARGVLLVNPTYHGICSHVQDIADIVHQKGIPLLVDEAHGPHLGFHRDLPPRAVDCGADAVVHGTHKMLSSLTQASMLHVKGQRICQARLEQSLKLLQSTSTSYLLLASLDSARADFAANGNDYLTRSLDMARVLRAKANAIPGLTAFNEDWATSRGALGLDRTKVTITVKNLKITGLWAETWLRDYCNLQVEMADPYNLLVIITAGNTMAEIEALAAGLEAMAGTIRLINPPPSSLSIFKTLYLPPEAPISCSPREAFFRQAKPVLLETAAGRVAAETVACYPPGIPVLCPGERILPDMIDYLQLGRELGMHFQGPQDPVLKTIRVLL